MQKSEEVFTDFVSFMLQEKLMEWDVFCGVLNVSFYRIVDHEIVVTNNLIEYQVAQPLDALLEIGIKVSL